MEGLIKTDQLWEDSALHHKNMIIMLEIIADQRTHIFTERS